jgi:hypothetical protein
MADLEWGTRLAMHNSQPGAEAVEHALIPRRRSGEEAPFSSSAVRSAAKPAPIDRAECDVVGLL